MALPRRLQPTHPRISDVLEHIRPDIQPPPDPLHVAMDQAAALAGLGFAVEDHNELAPMLIVRAYEHGGVVSTATGLLTIRAPLYATWLARRNALGSPAASSSTISAVERLVCERGELFASDAIGVREVMGDLLTHFRAAGGHTAWGFPVSDAYEPLDRDGIAQLFAGGKAVVRRGAAELLPRLPLFSFAMPSGLVGDDVIASVTAAVSFPGIEVHPASHRFDAEGANHVAVWLHAIERERGIVAAIPLVRSLEREWSLTAYADGIADALALYLDGLDHRIAFDGGDIDVRSSSVSVLAGPRSNTVVLQIHARLAIQLGDAHLNAEVIVRDELGIAPDGGISSKRTTSVDTDESWIHIVMNMLFPVFGSLVIGDVAKAFVPTGALVDLAEAIPLPYEVLIPGTTRKARFAAYSLARVAGEPDRLTIEGLDVFRPREPSVAFSRKGGTFRGATDDMRDPSFAWTFSWLPGDHPAGRTVEVTMPAQDPGNLRVRVVATDVDGQTAAHSRGFALAEPTPTIPERVVGGRRRDP